MRSLIIVTAGLSTPSTTRALADALSTATSAHLHARGDEAQVTVIELRQLAAELALAMTDWLAPTPLLDAAKASLVAADGLIAVSPVFQGSYSGLFKMFFDTLDPHALDGLPTLIAATGGSHRHALVLDYALRPLLNYLHATVVPTGVYQAAEELAAAPEVGHPALAARIDRASGELTDLMAARHMHSVL